MGVGSEGGQQQTGGEGKDVRERGVKRMQWKGNGLDKI